MQIKEMIKRSLCYLIKGGIGDTNYYKEAVDGERK